MPRSKLQIGLARNWILCFPRLYCLCCGSLLLLQRFLAFKNSSINELKWNVCVYTFFVVYFEWKRDWLCWLTWRSRSIVPSQPLNTLIHSNIFSQSQNSHQNQFKNARSTFNAHDNFKLRSGCGNSVYHKMLIEQSRFVVLIPFARPRNCSLKRFFIFLYRFYLNQSHRPRALRNSSRHKCKREKMEFQWAGVCVVINDN